MESPHKDSKPDKCVCVCVCLCRRRPFQCLSDLIRSVRANKLLHGLRTLQMGHCLEVASLCIHMYLNVHEHKSV